MKTTQERSPPSLAARCRRSPSPSRPSVKLDRAPIDPHDIASLQRGAHAFVNYCLNCHSASYMRYNRLQDLGLTEQQIRDNLVFTGVKVGDLMKIAMDPKDAKEWFGTRAARSDRDRALALVRTPAAARDWLYTYLRALLPRPVAPDRLEQPRLSRTSACRTSLWQLQGEQVLKEAQERADGYMKTVQKLALDKPGTLKPGRVRPARRRPRELHGLHGRAGAARPRDDRACMCCS